VKVKGGLPASEVGAFGNAILVFLLESFFEANHV
jgi:hypothetical protein